MRWWIFQLDRPLSSIMITLKHLQRFVQVGWLNIIVWTLQHDFSDFSVVSEKDWLCGNLLVGYSCGNDPHMALECTLGTIGGSEVSKGFREKLWKLHQLKSLKSTCTWRRERDKCLFLFSWQRKFIRTSMFYKNTMRDLYTIYQTEIWRERFYPKKD